MANTKITTNVIADGAITSAKLDTNITISGNITGTLATAAQPNITSLGTLTALTGGTGDLNWDSGTLFVDSSANKVGIGLTSPADYYADQLVVSAPGEGGITIASTATSNNNYLLFADGTSGSEAYRGQIIYAHGSDTFSLSSAGDIVIDADGGDIYLNDGGTGRGQISMANTDLTIISATSDRDLIFKGVDGASVITALTLDMSDAGSAIFNGNVTIDGFTNEKYLTLRSGFAPEASGGVGLRAANHAASNRDGLAIYGHDGVSILTGQTERMRIDAAGDVGIGQTDPATTLHIGDGASHYVRIENAGSGDVSSGYQIYRGSSVGMSLYDNPADNTTSLQCAGSLNINAGGSGADLHVNTNGNVGIGTTSTSANFQINGSTDSGGATQNMLIKNTTTASFSSTAFVGTGRVLDLITNSSNNQDFSAIRFANAGGSRETAIAVVQDNTTTSDGTGQGDLVIQGYDGDSYIETQRFRANGASSSTGQRRTGSYTSFAYINHTYTFDHAGYSTAGTPANSNDHWLEVPLYSSYSSSAGGGWCEIDICWHATHAQAAHLHSYKLLWGSNHGRILNVSVASSSANATTGSYNPYVFTSSSQLYRHPTAGDAYMTKMYIQIKGSTNHSGARSITLRGVGHPSVKNLAPVIDHGSDSTPDGITPDSISSAITATG